MRSFNFALLLVFFWGLAFKLDAQRPVGTWKDYLNYSETIDLTLLHGTVYVATRNAVFAYNMQDNSLERYNKINGLSDVEIVSIHAHEASGSLFIGYANGNLDILKNDRISNFAAIKNSSVVGDKAIRHMSFLNSTAFISTGVGLLEFDIVKREVRDTFTINATGNISINETVILNDSIFAATNEGLFMASLESDLSIFSNWQIDLSVPSPFAEVVNCAVQNQRLYVNTPQGENPGLFMRETDYSWSVASSNIYIKKVNSSPMGLVLTAGYFSEVKGTDGKTRILYLSEYGDESMSANNVAGDADGNLWIADKYNGLVKRSPDETIEFIYPDGPASNHAFDLDFKMDRLWVATGAPERPGTWNNKFLLEGFYGLVDGKWKNFTRRSHPELLDMLFFDTPKIYIDPADKDRIYVGSYFSGFTIVENNEIVGFYSDNNTSLGERTEYVRSDGLSWVGVPGIAKDYNGNMWFTSSYATEPLSVNTVSGDWKSFNLLGSNGLSTNKNLTELMVDRYNRLWAIVNRGGIVVFDPGESIEDASDDRVRLLTAEIGKGGLPANEVICMAEDLDGEIWVGTMDGIGVFYSPFDVLNQNFSDARKILVQQNGIYQYLLESQAVSAIAVDGANRKWIGTNGSGLFLMSPNGTEEIFRFTFENSPLISDIIHDIEIDPKTGEVFIATAQGVVSFISTATGGMGANNCLLVYPNPVRDHHDGPISITGLMRDSQIRITDARGNLVYRGVSNGGKAIWDAKNTNGQRVATGVYFVLATDDEGESTCVSKILVIK